MSDDAWFSRLRQQHHEILGETQLLSGIPERWRDLFSEWVHEIEVAGAIEAGMRVESLSQKHDTLRAELVGRSAGDPRWDAFETNLEGRSEAMKAKESTDG